MSFLFAILFLTQEPTSKDFHLFRNEEQNVVPPVVPPIKPAKPDPNEGLAPDVRLIEVDPRRKAIWRLVYVDGRQMTVLGYDKANGRFDMIVDKLGRPLYVRQPTVIRSAPARQVIIVRERYAYAY